MRFRSIVGAAGLALVVGCGSGEAPATEAPAERATNVRVLGVSTRDFEETLTITGPVRAVRAADISTEEGGVVEAVVRDRGSRVDAGQVVLRLERDMLDAERRSAEAARVLRQYNEERTRTLMEANSISKQEMLIAHTELVRAQEAERMAQLRWERAAIKAPFGGIVAERYVEVGELVGPGTRVARIVDPFVLRLGGWIAAEVDVEPAGGGKMRPDFLVPVPGVARRPAPHGRMQQA